MSHSNQTFQHVQLMFDESFFKSLQLGEEEEEEEEECGDNKRKENKLPETRIEWMEKEGISTWPVEELGIECASDWQPSNVLKDLQSIKTDLMNHAPWEDKHLNEVDAKLVALEKRLSVLADRFLYEKAKAESASESGGLCIIQPANATQDFCNPDLIATLSKHDNQDKTTAAKTSIINMTTALTGNESMKNEKSNSTLDCKNIQQEDISDDLSDGLPPSLPHKLEPLPLLDVVTKQQGYSLKFWRIWKKFFCSEASCSILQCAFWWIWMEEFKRQEKEQVRLYTIMAEKFSLLLLNYTSSQNKDELFQYYPKCLSQAVFVVFCHAFPKSVNHFRTDEFLHRLCNYIYEWTTGIPCPTGCWKRWPMSGLDPTHTPTVLKLQHTASSNDKEETGIGLGPTFECVQFITSSQSPLLRHHFLVHKIHEMPSISVSGGNGGGTIMSRTQIKEEAPPSMTFKELLETSKKLSKKRNEVYEKQMLVHQQELSEVLAEHTAARLAMKREAKKLLSQKYEVSQRAEKILARYMPAAKSSTYMAETVDD